MNKDIQSMLATQYTLLGTRNRGVFEQMSELKSLRGKNKSVIERMMKRVDVEKQEFDESLMSLQGTRGVFTRLSNEVFTSLGMDILKIEIHRTRNLMEKCVFSSGLIEAVREFFSRVRANLATSNKKTDEIFVMMNIMYKKFSTDHGLTLSNPMAFSLDKYRVELDGVELLFQKQFGAVTMLTNTRVALMQKFFDSIAHRVKQCFLKANRDVEAWQKVVMAPLEAQIREHKLQLKNRMQSIQRIHMATDSLEEKIAAFEAMQLELDMQKKALAGMEAGLIAALSQESGALRVAA